MEKIKNNSELNKIFDLKNFDWDTCFKKSMKSTLKEVCEYYKNNKNILVKEISEIFKISEGTVQKHLKDGNKIGLCNYPDGREKRNMNYGRKKIYVFNNKGDFLELCNSIKEASIKYLNIDKNKRNNSNIFLNCIGVTKSPVHKKYYFRYESDVIINGNKIIPVSWEILKEKYKKEEIKGK